MQGGVLKMTGDGSWVEEGPVSTDALEPEFTSKVDVALKLAVTLAKSFANVLNAIADTNTPRADDDPDNPYGSQRMMKNEALREAAMLGRLALDDVVQATASLAPELKIVQCARCRRYWLGSDVTTWRDLETRADFESDKPVTCCPGCEKMIGTVVDGGGV
jgi:hypothetical protein